MRHRFKVVIVTGVPGVGKTTVLQHLSRILGGSGISFTLVNLGDYMYEAARREGLVENRDELRRLNHRQQLELQGLAAQIIIEQASKSLSDQDLLIIDTHALVKTTVGLWPGLPEHVVSVLKPDIIVVIEASPEEVMARQISDTSRYRRDIASSPKELEEFMSMAKIAALASATKTGSAVAVVWNPQGGAEEAARRIADIIRHI